MDPIYRQPWLHFSSQRRSQAQLEVSLALWARTQNAGLFRPVFKIDRSIIGLELPHLAHFPSTVAGSQAASNSSKRWRHLSIDFLKLLFYLWILPFLLDTAFS